MIGKTVSHYRITAKLGAGGMGVVYQAEDTHLRRPVALKFLPPDLTRDDTAKQRFTQEARAASAIQHHNICTIHDIDETPEGQLFIVMDCYDGETLRARIDRGPQSVSDALDIAFQATDGLAKAHAAGIVHRDVKPANIMITSDGEVKIVDFGLSRLVGATRVTKTGTTMGTASYMSPEQTRGDEVDARSDVWSVGVMLYEMLAGTRPFTGEHDLAIAYGIMNNTPVPLSTCRSDVPDAVAQVIDRCLSKNKGDRFADAGALRDELERVRQGAPPHTATAGSATGAAGENGKRRRRHRTALTIGAAVVVVAAVVTLFATGRIPQRAAAKEHAIAIVDFRDLRAHPDATTAASITSLLNVAMVQNSPVRVVSPSYLHDLRRRLFGDAEGPIDAGQALELAKRSGATLMIAGDISNTGSEDAAGPMVVWQLIDTHTGRTISADRSTETTPMACADAIVAEALPHITSATGLAGPGTTTRVADLSTPSSEAFEHYMKGLQARDAYVPEAAREHLLKALEIDSTFALAHLGLSRVYMIQFQNYALSRVHAEAAWRHRVKLDVKERMMLEAARTGLQDDIYGCHAVYDEILERWPDDLDVLDDYLTMLYWRHHFVESLRIARLGMELYPDHYLFANVAAYALSHQGRHAEAIEIARKGLENNSNEANLWDSFGEILLLAGMPDSADAAYRKALSIDPESQTHAMGLARVAYARGDVAESIRQYEAIAARPGRSDFQIVDAISGYGWGDLGVAGALSEAGEHREALETLEASHVRVLENPGLQKMWGHRYGRLALQMHRYDSIQSTMMTLPDYRMRPYRRTELDWYVAMGQVRLGNTEAAREVIPRLQALRDLGWLKFRGLELRLDAYIALAEGEPALAVAKLDTLRETREIYSNLQETTHLIARAYHQNGQSELAIQTLQEFVSKWKGHALGHYELAKIYEDIGRTADARRELELFLEMWRDADEDAPQLIDAKKRLSRLEMAGT